MKKLILLFLMFLSVSVTAEELKFVTVLSSPVGSFNKLEAVDYETTVTSPVINFCTSIGNEGTITLRGKNNPSMEHLNLSANTVLGGNGSNYVLNKITMNYGGTLKGSRLLANTVQINNPTAGKSDHLYTNNLTVAGAKTEILDINGGESKITGPGDSNGKESMVWSNEYQTDNACGESCKNQYLLKQQRDTTPFLHCTERTVKESDIAGLTRCGHTDKEGDCWKEELDLKPNKEVKLDGRWEIEYCSSSNPYQGKSDTCKFPSSSGSYTFPTFGTDTTSSAIAACDFLGRFSPSTSTDWSWRPGMVRPSPGGTGDCEYYKHCTYCYCHFTLKCYAKKMYKIRSCVLK